MEKADVKRVLDAANVPKAVVERLSEGQFADEAAVIEAAQAEVNYLKKATGSDKVKGNGPSDEPKLPTKEERETRLKEIDARFGIGRY